jgi:hypothetical protein
MLHAIDGFCQAWGHAYDAVFFCQDHYRMDQVSDQYRAKVAHLQYAADEMVQAEYQPSQPLIFITRSLDLDGRTRWVIAHLDQLDLLTRGNSR